MRKGFTLIEILIVVIILAILATIAIPQFTKVVEKSRRGEALTHISAYQTGQRIFQLENNRFAGCLVLLDVDTIAAKDWVYTATNLTGTTFTIVATRSGAGSWAGQTIILNQNGCWSGTYDFKPAN